jgi:gluconate kinase
VYLRGEYQLIHARMSVRNEHYMRPGMLRSQFDDLEEPRDAVVADISRTPEEIAEGILAALSAGRKVEG